MKLNTLQKLSGFLFAGLLGSQVQAQTPDIPANVSGTYTLTYAYAAASGSPFTNGTVKTFVLNGTADTLCVDGVDLGGGYRPAGVTSQEIWWQAGGSVWYVMSLTNTGTLNEFNVHSPAATGAGVWKGQFPAAGGTFATSTTCGSPTTTPALTSDQQTVVDIAAGLYPDLFTGGGGIKSAQGYTYQSFTSGVTVGFKDGSLFVSGGPFGTAITNKGSVAAVTTSLQNLKSSVNVTPTADMSNLFTLAAQAYPSLFGGTGSTLTTSADGYAYRYYAATGLYAAVKGGNVFVKGGSYGNTYTSVGALSAVLTKLNTTLNAITANIPQGNFNLQVTGTVSLSGPVSVSQPFSFALNGVPAPSVSDVDAIKSAFTTSLGGSGATIGNFSFTVVENAATRVEFSVSATATVAGLTSSYLLNYVFSK